MLKGSSAPDPALTLSKHSSDHQLGFHFNGESHANERQECTTTTGERGEEEQRFVMVLRRRKLQNEWPCR